MSTYSDNLRIELIGTGTQAGTWGNTTNDNLATVLEAAIAGASSVSVSSSAQALTYLNGPTTTASANQSVRAILVLTTSTSANFAVYAPPVSKQYVVYNNSSYTATLYNSTVIGNTTAAGTGIAVPAGAKMALWSDGTNFYQQTTHLISPTIAGVTITGTATAPTQSANDNSTKLATTAYTDAAVVAATGALGTMSTQDSDNVTITGGSISVPAMTLAGYTLEKATITASAPSSTTNFDVITQLAQYYTSDATTNFTLNVRGDGSNTLNSVMSTGQAVTIALIVTCGATAYYPSALTIDGSAVTPKWQNGGTPSAGYASSLNSYVYTIIKTGSGAFTVLASQTKFA